MSVKYKTYFQILSIAPNSYWLWFALAFNAGAINLGAFLAANRFVTHITGYATYVGEDLSIGNYRQALLLLSVPMFFIIGCMISGFYTDRYRLKKENPKFNIIFSLICFILCFISIAGPYNIFGEFGNTLEFLPNYFLLSLLAMASGLQNAMISTATGLLVRTTHLTGISTDLGVGLVRLFSKYQSEQDKIHEFKTNILRLGTITSFILGSMISSFFYRKYGYNGFWFPTLIILFITIYNIKKPFLTKAHSK